MTGDRRKPRYERATVFNPDGVPVWADRHRLPADVAAHDHDFYEISLVTQGSGRHIAADGSHLIGPGSAVVTPPNQWHAYGECEDLVVYDCFVAPELIDTTLSFVEAELPLIRAVQSASLPLPQRVQLPPHQVSVAIGELHSMTDVTSQRSRMQVVGHLLIYLDMLNVAWSGEHAMQRRSLAPLHPSVSRAVELLEAEPAYAWSLAELAADTTTERTYLVRLFQRDLGVSPIAYLNRLREQAAARLLVQTDLPIADIGVQLGWSDAAYFARRFKSAYGMSPSAYRKRALTGETRYHAPAGVKPPLPVSGARFDVAHTG
ncbi:helix-turn-helix domain-containing protein [Streptomyces sp. 110]|uniref:Helix-turn-helix domain-containing protein n=1 Tax=Streptomyces endocoffeicus TaxID=2898945 RepID=A0ABS1Q689_9ACTN|nr:AraC family transcriptional regulator [Streptomyces endocoffeicus]MBL1120178.1 helix-turn-helix domain-containing protein [Streptomyces endocoffeicus]